MSFDLKAKEWDKDPKKVERAALFASEIIKGIKNKRRDKALEYGCGTGLVSFNLIGTFKHMTLADISDGMLEVVKEKMARQKVNNLTPIKLDLTNENIPGGYDAVYTMMTLHHILEIETIISKFHKILIPGGLFFIADLEEEDGSFHTGGDDFVGHHGFNRNELKNMLENNGFKVRENRIYDVIERTSEDHKIQKYPMFLMIGENL